MDEKRTTQTNYLTTVAEKKKISAKAEALNMSVGAYTRLMLLNGEVSVTLKTQAKSK